MNSNIEHIGLIGFSVRIPIIDQISRWDFEEYRKCLLVPTSELPVSFDEDIWPRFEDESKLLKWLGDSWEPEENGLSLVVNIPARAILRAKGTFVDRNAPILIAVTAFQNDIAFMDSEFGDMFDSYDSGSLLFIVVNSWRLLGYDVIDRNGTSVLVNCGLGCSWPSGVTANKKTIYAQQINEFGLFRESFEALDFITEFKSKISDHPPRYAVAIWATEAPER